MTSGPPKDLYLLTFLCPLHLAPAYAPQYINVKIAMRIQYYPPQNHHFLPLVWHPHTEYSLELHPNIMSLTTSSTVMTL